MLRARPVEDRHVRASARREGLRLQAINQGALARVGLARSARQRFSDGVVPLRMYVVVSSVSPRASMEMPPSAWPVEMPDSRSFNLGLQ